MSNFDGSRNLQLNNLNCVNTMTVANLLANNISYSGVDFLTLLASENENQTNTNFLCTNLTVGSLRNTNSIITNLTSSNVVITNVSSSNLNVSNLTITTLATAANISSNNITSNNLIVSTNTVSNSLITNLRNTSNTLTNSLSTNITSSTLTISGTTGGFRISDNCAANFDAQTGSPASRLSIVKKAGGGPSIAIANNSTLDFTVCNSTSAELVVANTYTTIAQLSTSGILSTTAFQQILPKINTSTSRNNTFIFNTISGNFIHTINTVTTAPNVAPLSGLGAITTNYSAGTRWDSSSGTSPLWRTPPGPGLYEIKFNGCLDAYTTGTLNWDLFDVTAGVTRSSLNTIDMNKERTWNLNQLFTSGNHTSLYCARLWTNAGTASSSQTTFSIRCVERWS